MISCKETTILISQSLDRRLIMGERFSMHWHLILCSLCTAFRRQIELVHSAGQRYTRTVDRDTSPGPHLSASARQRIGAAIRQAQNRT